MMKMNVYNEQSVTWKQEMTEGPRLTPWALKMPTASFLR